MTSPNEDGGSSATMIAAVGIVLALGLFLAMSYLLLGPMLLTVGVIAVAFVGFGTLHYLWWGRSMPDQPADDAEKQP